MLTRKKMLLISGATTATLGGVIVATTAGNHKAISLKEQLIKSGRKHVENWSDKLTSLNIIDTKILEEYGVYKVDSQGLNRFSPKEWCEENEGKIEDKDGLLKKVEEICFETVSSKLTKGNKRLLMESEGDEWNKKWEKFKQEKQTDRGTHWNFDNSLMISSGPSIAPKEFKDQCKSNSRKPLINDDMTIFKDVETYCTTNWKPI